MELSPPADSQTWIVLLILSTMSLHKGGTEVRVETVPCFQNKHCKWAVLFHECNARKASERLACGITDRQMSAVFKWIFSQGLLRFSPKVTLSLKRQMQLSSEFMRKLKFCKKLMARHCYNYSPTRWLHLNQNILNKMYGCWRLECCSS